MQPWAFNPLVTLSTSTPHTTTRTTASTKLEMAPSAYTTSSRPSRAHGMANSTSSSRTHANSILLCHSSFFVPPHSNTTSSLSTSSQRVYPSSGCSVENVFFSIVISPTSCLRMGRLSKAGWRRGTSGCSRRSIAIPWIGSRRSRHVCAFLLGLGMAFDTRFFLGQADTLVANSQFTARITMAHLSSIASTPKVVYPGINIGAYQIPIDWTEPDIIRITS